MNETEETEIKMDKEEGEFPLQNKIHLFGCWENEITEKKKTQEMCD